jgi:hypothetical protein
MLSALTEKRDISVHKKNLQTSPVVWWSEFLITDREIPGSILGSAMGVFFFLEGEDPHGDHGLGSLVEFRFNPLKPTGYVMHQQFNIQQSYALYTLHLCVLYLSENKQRLVPLMP